MSDQEQKMKRSRRIQQENNSINKQVKIAKSNGLEIKQNEKHRLSKHHALDCGVPDCPMCSSPRKLWGQKTKQEQSFEQTRKWIENE